VVVMRAGRGIGIATTAALVMATPLFAGWSPARADEAAALRANQELLQRRLDQLAQIPAPGSPYPSGPRAKTAGAGIVGGSFPRSFLVPGTDTSIRVGGEIRLVTDYYFSGGNPNQGTPWNTTVGDNGQAQSVPLNIHVPVPIGTGGAVARARSNSIFGMSPRESKLFIETRTPTAWGEARTYMEFDWAGSTAFAPGGANPTSVSDNLHPRLRFAYATLGGLLAGQANSNFSDPDASQETIDFGGNFGSPGVVRVPQVRYTMPLAPYGVLGAFSVSAEQPETDVWTPVGIRGQDASTGSNGPASVAGVPFNPLKTPAPDLTAAWYVPQPWGHFDVSAVVRPALRISDGVFVDKTYTGYGIHFGGDVKPRWFGWNRDNITWHFVYGDAIGRYLNTSRGFSLVSNYPAAIPGTAGAAGNVLVKPTVAWGGNVGYQHFWIPTLRSTISAGLYHHDINTDLRTVTAAGTTTGVSAVCSKSGTPSPSQTGGGGCALNKELINAHVNLIWTPVPFADLGIEYTWAHRVVVSNLKGDMNTLIGRFRVRF
jgi:hypothetical protein